MTTNLPSLDALRTAASTSASVVGSATAPPRISVKTAGKRFDTPNTEGMNPAAACCDGDDTALVGACTGTVAVAVGVADRNHRAPATRAGNQEIKLRVKGMMIVVVVDCKRNFLFANPTAVVVSE